MGGNDVSGSGSRTSRNDQDFEDLQNEISGRDVGRNTRFINRTDNTVAAAQRRDAKMHMQITALQAMLQNDPEYAQLYNDTNDLLDRAETAADNAIDQLTQDLSEHEQELNETLENASCLPDGTRVFKDEYGYVWTEDDELVAPKDAEGIVWNENSPSREEYMQQRQKVDETRRRIEDIQHYQIEVIGNARDRMNDQDNPVTPEEMERIQEDVIEHADPYVKNIIQPDSAPVEFKPNLNHDAVPPI